jgi:hypothetical protein
MHKNAEFNKMRQRKMKLYIDEVNEGKRTIYCASIHDEESMKLHYYNKEWAEENFRFFIEHGN